MLPYYLSPLHTMNLLSATFVCNFCLQLLCVSYSTVQTMKLLYATSPYLLLFPAKIMHICIQPLSTWCLLRRTKV